MTDETNPQIEATLEELADLVCQSLEGKDDGLIDRRDDLLKTLVMCGYARKKGRSVVQEVETRVKDRCGDPAMHRGGALSSMTSELGAKLEEISRWESNRPEEAKSPADQAPPKAANISAATDA